MSEPFSPVAVEDAIRTAATRIAKGVGVWKTALEAFLTADREYDRAFAQAYMVHEGAAHEKNAMRRSWGPIGSGSTATPARSPTSMRTAS